jgi:hypothetical protein
MRFFFFSLLLIPTFILAELPLVPAAEEASTLPSNIHAVMSLDPKARALDFKEAFETLRKEKTSNKVIFRLSDGTTLANVIEMSVLGNGTLVLFKINSMQGIKLQVVEIEKIAAISHL